jgi:hypothetical protein
MPIRLKVNNTLYDSKTKPFLKKSSEEPVGEFRRRPESEPFFRLAKTAKQAMFVLSSIQPDAAKRKKSRSKPDRVRRQAPKPEQCSFLQCSPGY